MFSGVDSVIVLWRFESADGKPSRNDAKALPSVVLLLPPFDEVMSLSKSKMPAPLPGLKLSNPIFRKSAPSFTVCVPKNLEKLPFALVDFQLSVYGSIAPRVCDANESYPRMRTSG